MRDKDRLVGVDELCSGDVASRVRCSNQTSANVVASAFQGIEDHYNNPDRDSEAALERIGSSDDFEMPGNRTKPNMRKA